MWAAHAAHAQPAAPPPSVSALGEITRAVALEQPARLWLDTTRAGSLVCDAATGACAEVASAPAKFQAVCVMRLSNGWLWAMDATGQVVTACPERCGDGAAELPEPVRAPIAGRAQGPTLGCGNTDDGGLWWLGAGNGPLRYAPNPSAPLEPVPLPDALRGALRDVQATPNGVGILTDTQAWLWRPPRRGQPGAWAAPVALPKPDDGCATRRLFYAPPAHGPKAPVLAAGWWSASACALSPLRLFGTPGGLDTAQRLPARPNARRVLGRPVVANSVGLSLLTERRDTPRSPRLLRLAQPSATLAAVASWVPNPRALVEAEGQVWLLGRGAVRLNDHRSLALHRRSDGRPWGDVRLESAADGHRAVVLDAPEALWVWTPGNARPAPVPLSDGMGAAMTSIRLERADDGPMELRATMRDGDVFGFPLLEGAAWTERAASSSTDARHTARDPAPNAKRAPEAPRDLGIPQGVWVALAIALAVGGALAVRAWRPRPEDPG